MQVSRWWKYVAIVAIILCVIQASFVMWMSYQWPTGVMLHDDAPFVDDPDPSIHHLVGMVFAVRGKPKDLPAGWMPCDGRLMDRKTHPGLYTVIGSYYSVDLDEFRLPDYRGMFAPTKETLGSVFFNLIIGRPTDQTPSGPIFALFRDELSFEPVLWAIRVK